MTLLEFLQVPLFQRAAAAALISGGTISLLGVVITTFNLTTIRFALMHFGLLGGAIGLAFGASPMTAAMISIAVGSFLFGPLTDKLKLDIGLIGAFFMTGTIAVAFILFYKAGVPAQEIFGLFTGSILTLTQRDLWQILLLGLVIVAVFVIFYREIQLIFYDMDQAEWLGVPAKNLRNLLLLLTGIAIGVAMRIVGALLMDSLILIPAITAHGFARNLKQFLLFTSLCGMLTSVGGLFLSMILDLPTGAAITLTGVSLLFFSLLVQHFTK
ncbi:MAG: metal ABC transporter permease [Bacillota bacterium]|nr:metal ABC transporter permease [Bacillota bacterium]